MSKKNKKVSKKFVKKQFNLVGLSLMLYVLIVLIAPLIVKIYFDTTLGQFVGNKTIKIGILYAFILIGTFVPFSLLEFGTKTKLGDFWRKCSISFYDIFVYTVLFTAIGTIIMFITSILNSYIYLGSGTVSSIGVSMPGEFLNNPLYFVLFVIATPIVEEIAFRGVLLRVLGRYGNRFGMISCSLIYALLHLTFADSITTFFLSIILIKITLRYRSVQPAIIIHMLFNLIIYGLELLPVNLYYVTAIVIFGIYLLLAVLLITRQVKFIKIRSRTNDKYIYKLFFTRPAVIIAIILMLGYSVATMFYLL